MREERWRSKMERSPFHVDLVAEQERIDEVRGGRRCVLCSAPVVPHGGEWGSVADRKPRCGSLGCCTSDGCPVHGACRRTGCGCEKKPADRS